MVSSMTGYGRGESGGNDRRYIVEVRSENNRFFEVSFRLPKSMASLEQKMKGLVQQYIARGRIFLTMNVEGPDDGKQGLTLDGEVARSYYQILSELKEKLGLPGEITVDVLTRFPNILTFEPAEGDMEQEWPLIEDAVHRAVTSLVDMRRAEGARLQSDLEKRIDLLENLTAEIEELAPLGVAEAKQKLEERLKSLVETDQIDPLRLALEIGVITERCDVTEECVRLHSHNQLFRETLKASDPVGKRLNFLLQEMNREANTIGSKAFDAKISHLVVQIKEEIEKLREQVQNIE
ncbi:MAG: YicC/YloC family endoribonuclease [bacterium]